MRFRRKLRGQHINSYSQVINRHKKVAEKAGVGALRAKIASKIWALGRWKRNDLAAPAAYFRPINQNKY